MPLSSGLVSQSPIRCITSDGPRRLRNSSVCPVPYASLYQTMQLAVSALCPPNGYLEHITLGWGSLKARNGFMLLFYFH